VKAGMLRMGIGAVGVVIGVFGAWTLWSRQDLDQLVSAAIWLVVGVVLHDGVLAVATLALAAIGLRLLPQAVRAPAVVGFVVLGSVTLLAVPVLGRFGARPDNVTLLDRDYTAGWLVLAVVTLLAVVVASLLCSRSAADKGGARGPRPGGRRRPHRA
jgi:hypothetical protein